MHISSDQGGKKKLASESKKLGFDETTLETE